MREGRTVLPPSVLSLGSIPSFHVQLDSGHRLGNKLVQRSQDQTSQVSSPAGAIPCFEWRNQRGNMSQGGGLGCGVAAGMGASPKENVWVFDGLLDSHGMRLIRAV